MEILDKRRINITVHGDISDNLVLHSVGRVIDAGKISKTRGTEHYCLHSQFSYATQMGGSVSLEVDSGITKAGHLTFDVRGAD